MPKRTSITGSELFIVDNSHDDWKAIRYLRDWCGLSKAIDIATGYFEISSLIALDGEWQKADKIRILMGDEVSLRTKRAFEQGLASVVNRLDESIEVEKEKNDFLTGVDAIAAALRSKKIECRVYRKDKFHAKCYLTHARQEVIGSFGLVGSSNMTYPGLTQNVELNVQITGSPVAVLQEWYEEHWDGAEDVTPEILKTIDRHIQQFTPFEVYAKALQEFFRGHELTASEWEEHESKVYPRLARYQKEAYQGLMKRASRFNGAFLCDGVGLGKTFVGLMLIERLIYHDRKKVLLLVPKSGRESVWETNLRKYLPGLFGRFSNLEIFNHTDLLRASLAEDLQSVAERADVVLIDEGHNFRNTGTKGDDINDRKSRYWALFDLIGSKTVFLLTATPVNNKLTDFQHMVELFSRQQPDYFKDAPTGIHSLAGHIRKLEKEIEKSVSVSAPEGEFIETNMVEAEEVMSRDALFKNLVVQRSRAYVIESSTVEDGAVLFPKPKTPQVAEYSVKQTYGKLLSMVEEAFKKDKPLFSLAIYYPLHYYLGDDKSIDPFSENRQKTVVSLIRTNFLKRFESSVEAFRQSCWALMIKLLAWVEVHLETTTEKHRLDKWKRRNESLLGVTVVRQKQLFGDDDEEPEEDLIPPEMLESVNRLDRSEFDVSAIISESIDDLEQLADLLAELEKFKPSQDKKLSELKRLLKNDPILKKGNKVLVFTEFSATARYLHQQLTEAGFTQVEQIDGQVSPRGRSEVIRRFAPYYNDCSSSQLEREGLQEITVLISTDVLSGGLNLQDATRLINYDLHWNPVRLMQRIGRIDRRMNPEIEAALVADHPEQAKLRGEVGYWNFLPPSELDILLKLFTTVTKKTLRISRTLGIEGGKLLTPDDEFDDLRNFTERYYGTKTLEEEMHLEFQSMLKEDPTLEARLNSLPLRVFSGKQHPSHGARGVFFCYAKPAEDHDQSKLAGESIWNCESGDVGWYLYDLKTEKILEDPAQMIDFIRCKRDTERHTALPQPTLLQIREKLDRHLKNTYLKKVQAPIGIKPVLKAWMELS